MASIIAFVKRAYTALNPPIATSSAQETPIRFGVLSAARITPMALIIPAKNHPEVTVVAVAARSLDKAQEFAKKWGIEKAYGGPEAYQQLIDDPNVDAIYNPLPNGLHYEWTMKALAAGKHVLLEKPSADTAEETRKMFELAQEKGLVLLEAGHYRFHPMIHRVKQIIESGEIGALKSVEEIFAIPRGVYLKPDDIRYDFALGGGSLMDQGYYAINCLRFLTSSEPTSVISASSIPHPKDSRVDLGMTASLAFPNDIIGSVSTHMAVPPLFGFIPRTLPKTDCKVVGEKGEIFVNGWVIPTFYHYIEVTVKDGGRTKKRIEKVYEPRDVKAGPVKEWKGDTWWTSYRYQLEAFVDKLKGREPVTWISGNDSFANMKAIEMVYEKAGLPIRPASAFQSSA